LRLWNIDGCRSTYEYAGDEGNLQDGGGYSKQDGLQNERDTLCPSVNCTSETSGLAAEVEFEVEVEEMLKGLPSDFADGSLADICKDGIQELSG
jgi:hypothetical protein